MVRQIDNGAAIRNSFGNMVNNDDDGCWFALKERLPVMAVIVVLLVLVL